jgi:hypothetical protein
MANEFQFGHTQNGSFALTIHSPILAKPIEYRQMTLPGIEPIPVETIPPVPRRIVERIVRGLIATKNAVQQQNIDALVHLEYSVLWSPKIDPPDDIANVSPVLLNGTDYAYLERAANDMKKLEEEKPVTVHGIVEGLTSPDDPHKFGVGQSIVVKWDRLDLGRAIKIIIDLDPDEYLQAIDAHENYRPVEVSGVAKQIGTKWKLFSHTNFHVVP